MVSMKLAVVHRPITAPNQSKAPVRACIISPIGPASALATSGGRRDRMVTTVSWASSPRPTRWAKAEATRMNGNIATSEM